jgi:hypothetical protein
VPATRNLPGSRIGKPRTSSGARDDLNARRAGSRADCLHEARRVAVRFVGVQDPAGRRTGELREAVGELRCVEDLRREPVCPAATARCIRALASASGRSTSMPFFECARRRGCGELGDPRQQGGAPRRRVLRARRTDCIATQRAADPLTTPWGRACRSLGILLHPSG